MPRIPGPHFRTVRGPAGSRCNLRIAAPPDAISQAGRGRSECHAIANRVPAVVGRNGIPTYEPCAGHRGSECHSDLRTVRRPLWVGMAFRLANRGPAAVGRIGIPTYEPWAGWRGSEWHSDLRTMRRPLWVGAALWLANRAPAAAGRNASATCEPCAGRGRSECHAIANRGPAVAVNRRRPPTQVSQRESRIGSMPKPDEQERGHS